MKKFSLLLVSLLVSLISFSQSASKVKSYNLKQGEYVQFNSAKTDTLKSGDSIAYVFRISRSNSITPIIDLRPLVIANDTTIALTVLESIDGITYYAVNAGTSPSAYTKTVAKGSTAIEYNGASDVVWYEGRYLKLLFIAKTKSGFKKVLSGYVGANIK